MRIKKLAWLLPKVNTSGSKMSVYIFLIIFNIFSNVSKLCTSFFQTWPSWTCPMPPAMSQMLANLIMQKKTVSFAPCVLQIVRYLACAVTEYEFGSDILWLVGADLPSPDYTVNMSWRVCTVLATTCWLFRFLLPLVHIALILMLPFLDHKKSATLSVKSGGYSNRPVLTLGPTKLSSLWALGLS